MTLTIELMNYENLKDIYKFELNNREYFEKLLPPRPKSYLNYDTFKITMEEIIKEQNNRECYMHVIRNQTGKMIGRVNLNCIETEDLVKAEIGYRFDEHEQGKGYASYAVKEILNKALNDYGIQVIRAGTATNNFKSQKLLEKNGFKLVGKEYEVMKVNGQWVDGLLYEKRL